MRERERESVIERESERESERERERERESEREREREREHYGTKLQLNPAMPPASDLITPPNCDKTFLFPDGVGAAACDYPHGPNADFPSHIATTYLREIHATLGSQLEPYDE